MRTIAIVFCILTIIFTGCNGTQNTKTGLLQEGTGRIQEDVKVRFEADETAFLGESITWELHLENTTKLKYKIYALLSNRALTYNAMLLGTVKDVAKTVELGPGQTKSVKLILEESEYLDWVAKTMTFETTAGVEMVGDDQILFLGEQRVIMSSKPIKIDFVNNTPSLSGAPLTCRARWVNPLSVTLHNVKVTFDLRNKLSVNDQQIIETNVPDIAPGQQMQISQDGIKALETGSASISVQLRCDELREVRGWKNINIIGPNNQP